MKDWIECGSCWAEFKVVSDTDEPLQYCPYCGEQLELTDEDEEEFEEDQDYDYD